MRWGSGESMLAVILLAAALLLPFQPLAGQVGGESIEAVSTEPVTAVSIHVETIVPGSPEWVYDEITGDVSEWWDHRFSEDPHKFVLEARPGGLFLETFDASGDGVVHAEVIYARRGERIRFDGALGFSGQPVQIVTTYEFAAVGADSTELVVSVNAAGPLDEDEIGALQRVWDHFIIQRFKPYVEARYNEHN